MSERDSYTAEAERNDNSGRAWAAPAEPYTLMVGDWREETVALHGPAGHIASGLPVEAAAPIKAELNRLAKADSILSPRGEGTEAVAWLIERKNWPQPMWWSAPEGWTADANAAMHFCRKIDAEALLDFHSLHGIAFASEHIWPAHPAGGEAPSVVTRDQVTEAIERANNMDVAVDQVMALIATLQAGGGSLRAAPFVPTEQAETPVVGLNGHDRHLVEVEFPNGMRLTIVREDEYDAVTVWSEDGEGVFTQADVAPRLAALASPHEAARLRDGLEEVVCWFGEAPHTFPDWKTTAEALADMAQNVLNGHPALSTPDARAAIAQATTPAEAGSPGIAAGDEPMSREEIRAAAASRIAARKQDGRA